VYTRLHNRKGQTSTLPTPPLFSPLLSLDTLSIHSSHPLFLHVPPTLTQPGSLWRHVSPRSRCGWRSVAKAFKSEIKHFLWRKTHKNLIHWKWQSPKSRHKFRRLIIVSGYHFCSGNNFILRWRWTLQIRSAVGVNNMKWNNKQHKNTYCWY